MDINESDNTIKEILDEDCTKTKKRRRGKGCFLRLLIIAVLLFIGFYGFILFRQKLLDLEAEAIIRARQTVSAEIDQMDAEAESIEPISGDEKATAVPTIDPILAHTATIAAQLTSVAEFQLSVTPDP